MDNRDTSRELGAPNELLKGNSRKKGWEKSVKEKFSIAFIGLGNRGKDAYLPEFAKLGDRVEITAIAEPDEGKRRDVAERYGIPPQDCFESGEELLLQPKLADALCIATMDRLHMKQAVMAMEKGYDILLEKPVSPFLEECRIISETAERTGSRVVICHVLRYTPFYKKVKEVLESGAIGTVVTIQAIENVGYWHQAHSFVRGNWRNANTSSPMILQKCCHDMDLYLWLAKKSSRRVSSFGSNYYFNKAHAPQGSSVRCMEGCQAKGNCPFDAEKIYVKHWKLGIESGNTGWPNDVLALHPSKETIYDAIRTGPYGRCVFACDNDVVDHQVVNVEMTDGSTMNFTMTGFTESNSRYAKFMGTQGELIADLGAETIMVQPFGLPAQTIHMPKEVGHGGGDAGIVQEFAALMLEGKSSSSLTSLDVSLESHYVALAAEKSRREGGTVIDIDEMRKKRKQ